jgi:replicative superfamily II helicase
LNDPLLFCPVAFVTPLNRPKTKQNAERGAAGACQLEHRRALPASSPKDRDRFVPLVAEAAKDGHSVLVFCGGRRQTEGCAAQVMMGECLGCKDNIVAAYIGDLLA